MKYFSRFSYVTFLQVLALVSGSTLWLDRTVECCMPEDQGSNPSGDNKCLYYNIILVLLGIYNILKK